MHSDSAHASNSRLGDRRPERRSRETWLEANYADPQDAEARDFSAFSARQPDCGGQRRRRMTRRRKSNSWRSGSVTRLRKRSSRDYSDVFTGTDPPLKDSEKHPHRRSSSSHRGGDTENPFRSTERGLYHRRGQRRARFRLIPPIPAPRRAAVERVCSPGNSGPPSLCSAKRLPACRSAANLGQSVARLRKCPCSGIARRQNDSVANAGSSGGCEVSLNSPIPGIDVETLAAKEAYQRHAKTLRHLYGQAGWRSYCRQDRDCGHYRLLHQFKACTPADSAARACVEIAPDAGGVDGDFGPQPDCHPIARVFRIIFPRFGAHQQNLTNIVDNPLGEEEPGREIQIGAGCAHGNREREAV